MNNNNNTIMEYNKDDNLPILVQFENGILRDNMKKSTKFTYLRSKVPKSNKRMLLADTGSLTYNGNVIQKQNSLMKYYIGVVDKKSKKIETIEQCKICTLKPKVQEDLIINEDTNTPIKTFKQKSDTLVEAFGSSKQKRLLSSRKKTESVRETIGDKVADIAKKILLETPKTSSPPQTPLSTNETLIIPPQDKFAKKIQDIYHIDDIISFQDYQSLKSHAQDFINVDNAKLQTWKVEKMYPQFILHHLGQLPISSSEREEKACYLCYLNYLIIIFQLSYKDIRKKDPCPQISNPLKNSLLDKFTYSENGRNRCVPKKYKDKVLCYALVLALIIEEYEMNCNLLLKDLKLGVTRLTKLLRAVGCTVRTTNSKKRKSGDDDTPIHAEPTVNAALSMSCVIIKEEKTTPVKKEVKKEIKTLPMTPKIKEEPMNEE